MSANEWITNRLPTKEDSCHGYVWATLGSHVYYFWFGYIGLGTPWQPITTPEPYFKPKRYVRVETCGNYMDRSWWRVRDTKTNTLLNLSMDTEELAVKFETFLNEVMP